MDDGKANAFTYSWAEELEAHLTNLEGDASKGVVLSGRPGRFSAGFDLSIMAQGPDAALPVIRRNSKVLMRLFSLSKPLVIACTGHAVAGGAVILLLGDLRLGADADYKVGLNEVAIGLPLPGFALRPAIARLAPPYQARALTNAEIFTPRHAVAAGYLDRLVEPERLEAEAVEAAATLGQLDGAAFAATKARLRDPIVAAVLEELEEDLKAVRLHLAR